MSGTRSHEADFIHIAERPNTDGPYTILTHEILDGNPGALIHVSRRFSLVSLAPRGAFFIPFVPGLTSSKFHTPASRFSSDFGTDLSLASEFYGVANNHYIAVMYSLQVRRWVIVNIDGAPMPLGAVFNVWAFASSDVRQGFYVHRATADNTLFNTSSLDNFGFNGRPDQPMLVTPRLPSPPIASTPFPTPYDMSALCHPICVWFNDRDGRIGYEGRTGRWNIAYADYLPIPTGASFNVFWVGANYGSFSDAHVRICVSDGSMSNQVPCRVASTDNPRTLLWYTQTMNFRGYPENLVYGPRDAPGTPNPNVTCLSWDYQRNVPVIFNENGARMERGVGFVVRHF